MRCRVITRRPSPSQPILCHFLIRTTVAQLLCPLFTTLLRNQFNGMGSRTDRIFLRITGRNHLTISLVSRSLQPVTGHVLRRGCFTLMSPSSDVCRSSSREASTYSFSDPTGGHSTTTGLAPPDRVASLSPGHPQCAGSVSNSLDPSSCLYVGTAIFVGTV